MGTIGGISVRALQRGSLCGPHAERRGPVRAGLSRFQGSQGTDQGKGHIFFFSSEFKVCSL